MKGMAAPYCRTSLQCNRDASNGPIGVMDDGTEPNHLTYEGSPAPRQSMAAFRPGCQLRRPVSLRSSQNSVLPDREFLDGDPVRFRRFRFLPGSPRHSIAVSVRELSCFQRCFCTPSPRKREESAAGTCRRGRWLHSMSVGGWFRASTFTLWCVRRRRAIRNPVRRTLPCR
jgi:hypothetical protein